MAHHILRPKIKTLLVQYVNVCMINFTASQLSFRSAIGSVERIREQVRKVLQLSRDKASNNPISNTRISSSNETVKQHLKDSEISAAKEVEDAVNKYLRRTSETYDLSKHYQVNRFTQALTATILLLFV